MSWQNAKVLVTGGASFIGSNLVDRLLERGAQVRVADDLSSGRLDNIKPHVDRKNVEFLQGDLLDAIFSRRAVKGIEVVFHLAAAHGGRGYVDLHQAECAGNLFLDGQLFKFCRDEGVKKIVYASSGCVYPNYKQMKPEEEVYLTEEMAGPPYDADNLYGWAKLMAEFTLDAYYKQYGIQSACCRYFTVYGPRGVENHAVIAMIARAFIKQDPFEVWGTGEQIRNWTYIDDIVEGTILAGEKIDDGTPVNLGTMERVRVMDAVNEILRYTGHKAKIVTKPDMPTGPLNRVADNRKAEKLLGWKPKVKFIDGLHKTIDWYFADRKREQVQGNLEKILLER